MKLVMFQIAGKPDVMPGLLTDRGVVSIAEAVPSGATPQSTMTGIIDNFDRLRPSLDRLARDGTAIPASDVRLRPPLARPGKILACIANYWEHGALEARPLNMFLKSSDAVIGPGDTIVLPEFTEPWIFMHEAELALVIKGPAKMVKRDNWRNAVFGYTGMIDVSARGEGRRTWKAGSWLGKSFDTFAPIGPCIATIDEIPNPNDVHVQFWVDGQLRHNYNTDDMEHLVPELVEFATTIMTLNSGDLIACGTNHEGLGPLQDGEVVDFEIHGVGRMRLQVRDPLKRTWEKGIYMGADSTHPEAVQRNRPYRSSAPASRPPASRISPGSNGGSTSKISRSTPTRSSVCRARESGRSQRSSSPANTVTMKRAASRPAAACSSRARRTRSPSRGCIACVLNPSACRPAMPAIRGPKPPTMIDGGGSGFRNPDCPDQSRRMSSIASTTRRARISSRSMD